MIALLQRVTHAAVTVGERRVAEVSKGLLVLVGVQRGDGARQGTRLAERIVAYRLFPDDAGRMNRSVADVDGEVLLVPQFTLAADTGQGNRPGFGAAAEPQEGERLFTELAAQVRRRHARVSTGVFGAYMQVLLCNDGPVTFWLQVPPES